MEYPLFCISVFFLFLFPYHVVSMSDAEALLALKLSIDPLNSLQWRGNDPCKWQGVKECMRGRVTKLVLEHFNLTGSLTDLNQLHQLRLLSFKDNSLSGQIPNLTALVNLKSLYLNDNHFSGDFPAYISTFHRLKIISLSGNQLSGSIPYSLLNLPRLYLLYLQNNRFSGDIPPLNQTSLRFLNLSNNQLSGEIPATSALIQFNSSSFSGNSKLCGEQINNPCKEKTSSAGKSSRRKRWKLIAIILGSVVVSLLVCSLVIFAIIICGRRRSKTERAEGYKEPEAIGGSGVTAEVSGNKVGEFRDPGAGRLVFCGGGDNNNYNLEDLLRATAETLGRGTLGTTYKALMETGFIVTVKRLKDARYPTVHDFVSHVELIGKLAHPNLVPLRAFFQSQEERLVVYDHFPNGSLFSLIHGTRSSGNGKPLHWTSCLKIADDLATALLYIHQHPAGLTHGNLKSSNVLLGSDFESCLTDYSLTPFINPESSEESMSAASTLFYRAPECRNSRSLVTQQADVYSFGVLLVELLTGHTPFRDLIEQHGSDIRSWVRTVRESEMESSDEPSSSNEGSEEKVGALLKIAMACVALKAEKRPHMRDVMRMVRETRSDGMVSSNSSELSARALSDTVGGLGREAPNLSI